MVLKNILNIDNQTELNRKEELLSKKRAKELFDEKILDKKMKNGNVGDFKELSFIHYYLFQDIYDFAGKIRNVNIAKGNFRFASVLYLQNALDSISKMPEENFDEIIEKYVEMNIAHPFREGNGRATRLWLDQILKYNLKKTIDWNKVDKEKYLTAMILSPVSDLEIKHLLKESLSDKINDHDTFFKGIDASYYYEGYSEFETKDL